MALMQPHVPSNHSLRSWLKDEWKHVSDMPPPQFYQLILPSLLLLLITPLLPCAAYALWRWAGSAWTWRDRWTSVRIWAHHGIWFVGLLIGVGTLGQVHFGFFPDLIVVTQMLWHAHLPGELSLSPLDGAALFARTLLLLPLAPALAFYYEHVDPRTHTPTEVLRPTASPPQVPTTTQEPAIDPSAAIHPSIRPRQTTRRRKNTPKKSTPPTIAQRTVDSDLAPHEKQTATPARPANIQYKKRKKTPEKQSTPSSAEPLSSTPKEIINWDNVAE